MTKELNHFINGALTGSSSNTHLDVVNPASGERLAKVPLGNAEDLERAVQAAQRAYSLWRQVPPVNRARLLFRYKSLLDQHAEELARIVTMEHGKTLNESRGSVRRGIENIEHACGIPTLMMGESLEDIAENIDTVTMRQPIGVFAAIAPYNFPAMVPNWFWPYAIMTGNTFILKPSEVVPMSSQFQIQLLQEAGFPSGVMNLVHGARDVVNAILEHPGIAGVSFVGSSPVAKMVYEKAAVAGKRVQALGGAKNYMVVMPDAHPEKTIAVALESAFGCAGQRCLAGSTVLFVGDAYDRFRGPLLEAARKIRVGNGLSDNVDMGPVISKAHKERVLAHIGQGVSEGATLALDGRNASVKDLPHGHFIAPTVFDNVHPHMTIAREEIFGPVLGIQRALSLEEAIKRVRESPYANATSIFTTAGKSARTFQHEVGVSMIGVNVGVPGPMAFFPFGGIKNSFFGDTKAHGKEAIRFYTDAKVVISRWF